LKNVMTLLGLNFIVTAHMDMSVRPITTLYILRRILIGTSSSFLPGLFSIYVPKVLNLRHTSSSLFYHWPNNHHVFSFWTHFRYLPMWENFLHQRRRTEKTSDETPSFFFLHQASFGSGRSFNYDHAKQGSSPHYPSSLAGILDSWFLALGSWFLIHIIQHIIHETNLTSTWDYLRRILSFIHHQSFQYVPSRSYKRAQKSRCWSSRA
jgi:hypothetical protein